MTFLSRIVAAITWGEKVNSEDVRSALSSCKKKLEDIEFVTFKSVYPYDLNFMNKGKIWKKRYFGWGKDLDERTLEKRMMSKYARVYFKKDVSHDPAIEIDGEIHDGGGRISFAHALGEKVRIAVFKTISPTKED